MDTIENFWDECQSKHIVESLSGCSYAETIDFLKLNNYIIKGKRVLEVGIGLGYVTRGLFDAGLEVSALDISNIALQCVRNYCTPYYLGFLDSLPSDYFDIIICNNVVQHVDTDTLKDELKHCIRSLKVGGVFAIEFVSNDEIEDMGINPSLDTLKNGGCCRSVKYMEKLINDLGGKCEVMFDNKVDIGVVKGHHVFHVTKDL